MASTRRSSAFAREGSVRVGGAAPCSIRGASSAGRAGRSVDGWTSALASAVMLMAGCHGSGEGAHGATTSSGAVAPSTCTVDGLEGATSRPALVLPVGCSFQGGGTASAPRVLGTEEDILALLSCPERDLSALGIDPSTHDVYLLAYTMSPASAGIAVYDDEQTLTYLSRFRPPCPNDPMPMPMSATVAWLMPKGATRATREASCSLPERCD